MSFLLDVLSGILANIISGKILMISKKRSQKSSNTQKHRELQLTVFLGFQSQLLYQLSYWCSYNFVIAKGFL